MLQRPCLLRKYRVFVYRYIKAKMKGHNITKKSLGGVL